MERLYWAHPKIGLNPAHQSSSWGKVKEQKSVGFRVLKQSSYQIFSMYVNLDSFMVQGKRYPIFVSLSIPLKEENNI
uniref:Ovule protein n=1 Tax=Steinernema glaseri TaxID=37863 RepID=A0A1I8A054_9BILA